MKIFQNKLIKFIASPHLSSTTPPDGSARTRKNSTNYFKSNTVESLSWTDKLISVSNKTLHGPSRVWRADIEKSEYKECLR